MPPKKGKNIKTTAAAARPRRSTATAAPAPAATPKPTVKANASKKRAAPATATETTGEPAKKRGRPTKAAAAPVSKAKAVAKSTTKATKAAKPGRPKKSVEGTAAAEHEHDALGEPLPHKRGEPPFGGETTKVAADETAAGDQLEEELLDTAKTGEPAVQSSGKQYWLMKAEQEDRVEQAHDGSTINTRFTIDDLKGKTEPELWDGEFFPSSNWRPRCEC